MGEKSFCDNVITNIPFASLGHVVHTFSMKSSESFNMQGTFICGLFYKMTYWMVARKSTFNIQHVAQN